MDRAVVARVATIGGLALVVAAFLVDGPVAAAVAVAIGVAACGAWHQAGIGTVTNLGFGADTPEIGAALVVVGLLIGIAEVRQPSS